MNVQRILTIALAGTVLTTSAVADTTVRLGTWLPPQYSLVLGGWDPFVEAIETASEGALSFEIVHGGGLVDQRSSLGGLADGIVDFGTIAVNYYPAELANSQLIAELGFQATDAMVAAAAATEYFIFNCPDCQEEFAQQGIVHLGAHSDGRVVFVSRSDRVAVPEDVSGLRIRQPGTPVWVRWVEHFDGVPVTIPFTDVYEGLNRGTIDAVLAPAETLDSFSFSEIAGSVTAEFPDATYAAFCTICVGREFWRDLSDEQRRLIIDNAAIVIVGGIDLMLRNADVAMANAIDSGVDVVEPLPELLESFAAFNANDRPTIVASAEEQYGIAGADGQIAIFLELRDKYTELFAATDGNPQAIIDILNQEIFSRIDETSYGL